MRELSILFNCCLDIFRANRGIIHLLDSLNFFVIKLSLPQVSPAILLLVTLSSLASKNKEKSFMQKIRKFWVLALFSLVLAGLLVACGDPTATAIPAKTTEAAMAGGSDSAMMKPTEGAMMAKTTEAAMMAKPTEGAMMAKTTEAAMAKPTSDAMAKGTEGAMMAKAAGPFSGEFNNQGAEPVAGKVTLGKTTDGKLVLRLENLKSANGPDLHVYLTKEASPSNDAQIKQGFEVGTLKATQGNLNYELDTSLDLSQYKSVAIYCKSASVVFGFANLASNPA
jgi:hypothetical protein